MLITTNSNDANYLEKMGFVPIIIIIKIVIEVWESVKVVGFVVEAFGVWARMCLMKREARGKDFTVQFKKIRGGRIYAEANLYTPLCSCTWNGRLHFSMLRSEQQLYYLHSTHNWLEWNVS